MRKYIQIFALLLLYLLLLLSVYLVHIKFFNINVVFYSAIVDGLISAIILIAIMYLPYFALINHSEKILLSIIFCLIGYIHAVTLPTIIDRSLSIYILEKLAQRGGGIKLSAFENIFTKEYVKEHRIVDVRLTEQLQSKTIVINGDCVTLTAKGRDIIKFTNYYRKNLLPKNRLLMGSYSADLTDPLKNSLASGVDYACK